MTGDSYREKRAKPPSGRGSSISAAGCPLASWGTPASHARRPAASSARVLPRAGVTVRWPGPEGMAASDRSRQ